MVCDRPTSFAGSTLPIGRVPPLLHAPTEAVAAMVSGGSAILFTEYSTSGWPGGLAEFRGMQSRSAAITCQQPTKPISSGLTATRATCRSFRQS
jgi:hypothetical protein